MRKLAAMLFLVACCSVTGIARAGETLLIDDELQGSTVAVRQGGPGRPGGPVNVLWILLMALALHVARRGRVAT